MVVATPPATAAASIAVQLGPTPTSIEAPATTSGMASSPTGSQ